MAQYQLFLYLMSVRAEVWIKPTTGDRSIFRAFSPELSAKEIDIRF